MDSSPSRENCSGLRSPERLIFGMEDILSYPANTVFWPVPKLSPALRPDNIRQINYVCIIMTKTPDRNKESKVCFGPWLQSCFSLSWGSSSVYGARSMQRRPLTSLQIRKLRARSELRPGIPSKGLPFMSHVPEPVTIN